MKFNFILMVACMNPNVNTPRKIFIYLLNSSQKMNCRSHLATAAFKIHGFPGLPLHSARSEAGGQVLFDTDE